LGILGRGLVHNIQPMKLLSDCVPCTLSKVIRLVRDKTHDEDKVRKAVEEFLAVMSESGIWDSPPMTLATRVYSRIRPIIGHEDFLREEKARQNQQALKLLHSAKDWVLRGDDPLHRAILLSVIGNIIDLGARPDYDLDSTLRSITQKGFARDDYPLLKQRLSSAKSLMLIADNAGEIVFDLFFLSLVDVPEKILSVRAKPYLNDATEKDIESLPYTEGLRVINPGADTLGVMLDQVSKEFMELFKRVDVVIAKGQANLESLDNNGIRDIFFATMIKCQPLADIMGVDKDSALLFHQAP